MVLGKLRHLVVLGKLPPSSGPGPWGGVHAPHIQTEQGLCARYFLTPNPIPLSPQPSRGRHESDHFSNEKTDTGAGCLHPPGVPGPLPWPAPSTSISGWGEGSVQAGLMDPNTWS